MYEKKVSCIISIISEAEGVLIDFTLLTLPPPSEDHPYW